MPMKKFDVILADPPWRFGDRLRSSKKKPDGKMDFRELERHYETMTINDICKLPVEKIAANSSVLFLWSTDAHLSQAMQVIKFWGFEYRTIGFIWNKKTVKGNQVCYYGKWTMKGSEVCLLATKGHPHNLLKVHNVRQLVEAERKGHSVKPKEVYRRIETMFGDVRYLELFARRKRQGWSSWGNEVNSDVVLTASNSNCTVTPAAEEPPQPGAGE